jgi:hypothetical protein
MRLSPAIQPEATGNVNSSASFGWRFSSHCGSGFWGGQRPSLAHYVTGMGPSVPIPS